jgi:hypothetical protein
MLIDGPVNPPPFSAISSTTLTNFDAGTCFCATQDYTDVSGTYDALTFNTKYSNIGAYIGFRLDTIKVVQGSGIKCSPDRSFLDKQCPDNVLTTSFPDSSPNGKLITRFYLNLVCSDESEDSKSTDVDVYSSIEYKSFRFTCLQLRQSDDGSTGFGVSASGRITHFFLAIKSN